MSSHARSLRVELTRPTASEQQGQARAPLPRGTRHPLHSRARDLLSVETITLAASSPRGEVHECPRSCADPRPSRHPVGAIDTEDHSHRTPERPPTDPCRSGVVRRPACPAGQVLATQLTSRSPHMAADRRQEGFPRLPFRRTPMTWLCPSALRRQPR